MVLTDGEFSVRDSLKIILFTLSTSSQCVEFTFLNDEKNSS